MAAAAAAEAEVQIVATEANTPSPTRSDQEFWQRLLAAEAHPQKTWALLNALRESDRCGIAVTRSPILSKAERERAASVSLEPVADLLANGGGILSPEELPEIYAQSQNLMPGLFFWGDPSCLSEPCVAIVGTRSASTYGKAVAQKFSEALAREGITIVSGGALGIDVAAHKGALDAGGKTVAVLITGIDRVYPRMHFGLFERIKKSGCLLSQFAVGRPSNREYRPLMRNQTVAGLSSAVIVVEAPETSGALSTAAAANELGRHVFVVPANIDNLNFRGSHSLIRDGATLVDHPDQVLEVLGIAPTKATPIRTSRLTSHQIKIMAVLGAAPLKTEHIVERTGLETSVILSELTMLELDGRVFKDRGGYAVKL